MSETQGQNCFNHSANFQDLRSVFCHIPFNEFHIYNDGMVSNCCFNWLPTSIGNIHKNTIIEISQNQISKNIQDSVKNGTFSFCSTENCPHLNSYLHGGTLRWPLSKRSNFDRIYRRELKKYIKLYLSFDYSCNLFCESCRNEKTFYTRATAPEMLLKTYEKVSCEIKQLIESGYRIEVNVTGSGDAFASPLYYQFLCDLPQTNLITVHLSTNGTMMTRKKLSAPFRERVKKNFISVDACREATYVKVRRGGHFQHVTENLQNFDQMVQEGFLPELDFWQLNFIVQQENYLEMADFVDWAKQFKTLNAIFFTKILDWQHLSKDRFIQKAVWSPEHPEHQAFRQVLNDPRLTDPRVILGNLTEYKGGLGARR